MLQTYHLSSLEDPIRTSESYSFVKYQQILTGDGFVFIF